MEPRNMPLAWYGMAKFPCLSIAIRPPWPPRLRMSSTASWADSARLCWRYIIRADTEYAADERMNSSPSPVAETAQDRLSAKVPAPMTALSPTRPGSLNETPPVEVAAARFPCRSRATAPTVPLLISPPDRTWRYFTLLGLFLAPRLEFIPTSLGAKVFGIDQFPNPHGRRIGLPARRPETRRSPSSSRRLRPEQGFESA